MPERNSLVSRDDFPGIDRIHHLAAAGESPFLASHRDVFDAFALDKAGGMAGRERIFERIDGARRSVATLMGVTADEIGFPLNVAQGINMVARTIDTRPGNVVMPQWEYPSLLYPWATGTGLEMRLVADSRHRMDLDRFAESVDDGTRAIVVSLVSYYTGERADLAALREIADRHGAMLIVDASHAFGAFPVDLALTDFTFGCGYKWILGTHGAGIAYCNAQRQPGWEARDSGWTSVRWVDADERDGTAVSVQDGRRFELGNPAALAALLLGNGVEYLRTVGLESIERHLLDLTRPLISALTGFGLDVLTPPDDAARAGIVAFRVDDEGLWRRELEARDVLAWVGDKRVRISPHLYNDEGDITAAIDAVGSILDSSR